LAAWRVVVAVVAGADVASVPEDAALVVWAVVVGIAVWASVVVRGRDLVRMALKETIRLMGEIDATIPSWPIDS
jgi:hypothetical protein